MNLNGMPYAEAPQNVIENNSFYPALDLSELSDNYGVTAGYGVNVKMIMVQLQLAMGFVNKELSKHQVLNWSNYTNLENVPSDTVDDTSLLVMQYKDAVFSLTKAKLLLSRLSETNRDKQAAKEQQASENEEYWRKKCYAAIRQITAVSENLSVALL